jgi:hypothetical protein
MTQSQAERTMSDFTFLFAAARLANLRELDRPAACTFKSGCAE